MQKKAITLANSVAKQSVTELRAKQIVMTALQKLTQTTKTLYIKFVKKCATSLPTDANTTGFGR